MAALEAHRVTGSFSLIAQCHESSVVAALLGVAFCGSGGARVTGTVNLLDPTILAKNEHSCCFFF
jgi:hypothetical protein